VGRPARLGQRPRRVVISSGPTREPVDAVRYLSNYSTGAMGRALAAEALRRGHRVTVVSGPAAEPLPRGARVIRVERAAEMAAALRRVLRRADALMMAAAVADYTPVRRATGKVPRARRLVLALRGTPDIVAGLPRRAGQVFVGFALERPPVVPRAAAKLRRKRLDLVLAQQLPAAARGSAPFGRRRVRAWLLAPAAAGRLLVQPLGRVTKARVASVLLDKVERLW